MAVVWLPRIAVLLAPLGLRLLQQASGPGADRIVTLSQQLWAAISDPAVSDEDVKELLDAHTGTVWAVTTVNEPFEVRRVQMAWTDLSAAGIAEDVRVCTFHSIYAPSGTPTDVWTETQFLAVRNALEAAWGAIKPWWPVHMHLASIKFYKEGPDVTPPQVPVYQTTYDVAGTSTGWACPPQIAMSVTERAGSKLHWGRFYLPAPAIAKTDATAAIDGYGRFTSAIRADVAAAFDTAYTACVDADVPIGVYRRPLPVRQTAAERRLEVEPGSLPARPGSFWTVTELAVDDVPDVIRSRRFSRPQAITVAPIAGA